MAPRIPVIFGTMTLGHPNTAGCRVDSKDAQQEIIDTYKRHGGIELDTARSYAGGTTEQVLADLDTSETTIDSKCYPANPGDHQPEKLRKSLEESLRALKVDQIRVFYLHAPDRATPFEDTLREADKMHKEGKFQQLGLSNYQAWEVAEIVTICDKEKFVKPTIYQGMYNAITRNVESELLNCLEKFSIRFVAYNPLAGGAFANKAKSVDAEGEKGGRFDSSTKQGQMYRERYFREAYFKALQHVEQALEGTDITLIGSALRWMEHHSRLKPTDGIIIGASSNQQLEQNMSELAKGPLPDKIVKALDDAWLMTKVNSPAYWR